MIGLFPFPGSKAGAKYDRYLYPGLTDAAICEPFAGAATRSLMYCDRLSIYLGEINPAQRAIIQVLHASQDYLDSYKEARDRFWSGLGSVQDQVLAYAGTRKSQTALRAELPDVCQQLTANWRSLCADIYDWIKSETIEKLSGYYAFAIRATFGNVLRLSPSGTHFNVSWHVDKLFHACKYNPRQLIAYLAAKRWNPAVFPSWEEAIAAVPDPAKTFLLLDPPYWIPGDKEKMTPAYCYHSIATEETFALAVHSLQAGLERGFASIAVCNYYSDRLDACVRQAAIAAGYSIQTSILGECRALGNSNGRRKHGQRVDKRDRPVEVIYRLEH